MGLVTQFSVQTTAGCEYFYFQDTTPAYNNVTALNGYGAPNPLASSIKTGEVLITNMADPTVTRTVILPTTSTVFDSTRIPGVFQYTITSYQTALSTTYPITSSTATTATGTIVYNCASHPYVLGQLVRITGSAVASHNVTGIITATSSNSFTISVPGITTGTSTNNPSATSQGYTNTAISPTDGVYKFVYNLLIGTVVYSATCYLVVDCTIGNTITSMLKELNCCDNCSDSNNTKLNMLYQVYLLREKACYLAVCQDYAGAQEILDCINAMIGTTTCDSCS